MPLLQTFHSVRYLKPSQIAWRVWYTARRRFEQKPLTPPQSLTLAKPLPIIPLAHHAPAWDQTTPDQLAQGQFTFFSQTFTLGASGAAPIDWKLGNQSQNRLWIISLHYHTWLFKLGSLTLDPASPHAPQAAQLFGTLLDDWLANASLQTPGSRALAWNAYACATRLSWWARLLWQPGAHTLLTPERSAKLAASIWIHARFLESNLEYDLRANHLLRDMIGLVYAGRLLEGPDALHWLELGSRLGIQQVQEQVLTDGGHFERSPMYHIHVMEDVLALACLAQTPQQRAQMKDTWLKMAGALQRMVHPDGLISLFNDAAFNGCESLADTLHAGKVCLSAQPDAKPLEPIETLPDFGLIRLQSPAWTVFFDVGPIGVDYQPGHAHADTLTLEASLFGHRLIVDPGTMAYDKGPVREYDRSTASHNTVTINGENSSQVWDVFRVAQRAQPVDVSFTRQPGHPTASGSHNGYDRLPGSPRHSRTIALMADTIQITDTITGANGRAISGGWLLSPDAQATQTPTGFQVQLAGHTIQVTIKPSDETSGFTTRLAPNTPYHLNFGQEIPASRLCFSAQPSGSKASASGAGAGAAFTIQTTFTLLPR
jgi:uncharacterized heparinase superfamily protein